MPPYKSITLSSEIEKFDLEAHKWWDPNGPFRPLHQMNPCRLTLIKKIICDHFNRPFKEFKPLMGLRILDIGCGGGLLTEPLARLGASVTGIDAGEKAIKEAIRHGESEQLNINYHMATAESFSANHSNSFDVIICFELLEHLDDLPSFFKALPPLLSPQGIMIFSTLNRTPQSFFGAIVGAEYLLRWVPRGTHSWNRFLKPSEIAFFLEEETLKIKCLRGMSYSLLQGEWEESDNLAVNYVAVATR